MLCPWSLIIRATSSFRLGANVLRFLLDMDFYLSKWIFHLSRCPGKLDHYNRDSIGFENEEIVMNTQDIPNDDTGQAIKRWAIDGSDITKPLKIDFFLDIADELIGEKIKKRVCPRRF